MKESLLEVDERFYSGITYNITLKNSHSQICKKMLNKVESMGVDMMFGLYEPLTIGTGGG